MDSWSEKKQQIASYYNRLVEEHGPGPRACDYGRPESQQIKFRVLSEVMPLTGKTVLDVGCGFADFADYLQSKLSGIHYSGVDITSSCVDGAKVAHPKLDIRCLDILTEDPGGPFDLVTANGIFYLMGGEAEALMATVIGRMFDLCTKAVAFNSLSSWCLDKEPGEFYADPLKVIEYCRELSPWLTLRHDYHTRDFTIYMYKNKTP